jgi:hypothetical protein
MAEKQGCEYREFCDVYNGKYEQSPVVAVGFRATCDGTLKKDFFKGLCPMYDSYSRLFGMISEHLQATNESLEGTIKRFRERE